jgi:hypothetical protein
MPPNVQIPAGVFPVEEQGTNLLSILINIAFGFIGGLMLLFGIVPVIEYGSKLTLDLILATGVGAQATMLPGVAGFAPYVVLAPIGAMVLKELSSVRSIKSFAYFSGAVFAGAVLAFLMRGYFEAFIV